MTTTDHAVMTDDGQYQFDVYTELACSGHDDCGVPQTFVWATIQAVRVETGECWIHRSFYLDQKPGEYSRELVERAVPVLRSIARRYATGWQPGEHWREIEPVPYSKAYYSEGWNERWLERERRGEDETGVDLSMIW